ncbi:MAG: hypothetical protein ACAI38_23855 [Myxococcota bacterium]
MCAFALGLTRCSSGIEAPDGAFTSLPPMVMFAADVPPAPVLIAPSGSGASPRPTFQWEAASGASFYELFVIESSTGNIFWQEGYPGDTHCVAGTCSLTPDLALSMGSATWWVRAANDVGHGRWSAAMTFSVESKRSAFEGGIYPQGERFGLVLLSAELTDPAAMQEALAAGWNVADSYWSSYWSDGGISPAFIDQAASQGFLAWAALDAQNYFAGCGASGGCFPYSESYMSGVIAERAAKGSMVWWSLPEEQRYWYAGEMDVVNSYASWTRVYDPAQRPNLMYIPGHYGVDAIAEYVPALDVVPASIYSQYKGQPHAWTRWRVESTVEAIAKAGASVGRDYLHGDKTVAAYLELFDYSGVSWPTRPTTAQGSVHDFWQAIVSGARALIVYAHVYRHVTPELTASWAALCNAAKALTGPENLEGALLYGTKEAGVSLDLLAGPPRTPPFLPDEPDAAMMDYPSADFLAVRYDGYVFVIVVSSAEDASIQVAVNGLPGAASADVLFEGRTLPLIDGRLVDDVESLGVHVYRAGKGGH